MSLNIRTVKAIPLWMPGSKFKHQAFHVKTLVRRTLDTPYEMVKRAMVRSRRVFLVVISATKWMWQMAGTAAPSLAATLVEEALAEGTLTAEHEEDIKGAAGVVYAGECPPFDVTTFAC